MFDLALASVGLLLVSPLLAVIALCILWDSGLPIFFRQKRMGKDLQPFRIYKFRTMVVDADRKGGQITPAEDPRITSVGRVLRNTKLDELPQLINVIVGDMSLVGPRPEVPKYVNLFISDYEEILKVKPGITDLASLKYSDESALLSKTDNPEGEYLERILPDKIRLSREYASRSSLRLDLEIMLRTVLKLAAGR